MSRSYLDNSASNARKHNARPDAAPSPDATDSGLKARLGHVDAPFALLESMFALSPMPYVIFGSDGRTVASNAAFHALFGRELGSECDEARDDIAGRLAQPDLIRRAFAGEAVHTEPAWYAPDELGPLDGHGGKRLALACSFFPLRDGDGAVAYVAGAYRDATADLEALERAEPELARLKALAEEKERLATALCESEEELRGTLEAADVGTWELNIPEGRVKWSSNVERIIGLEPGSFAGNYEAWLALIHPEDRAMMADKVSSTLATLAPYAAEFRSLRSDGSTMWQSARGYVIADSAGRPKLLRGVVLDVTARRVAEAALKVPAQVLDNMTEAVTLADQDGVLLYTNPAADEMFGYPTGELIGKHVTTLNAYAREENERITAEVIALLHRDGEWVGEWANQKKDGSPFTTRSRITLLELDGAPHFVSVQEDITLEVVGRRHTETLADSLRARERQLRLVTDALPALVTYMGVDRRFRFANNAYLSWFGVEPESLIGKHARELLGETGYRQIEPYMDRALAGEHVQYEREVTLADGRTIYAQMNYVPDKDEHGRTLGYVALIHDLTDRHRAELALQTERKRLHDILMHAPAAISMRTGPEGVFTFANGNFERLAAGRPLLGRTTRDAWPAPTTDRFMELIERVYATGKPATGTEVPTLLDAPDGGGSIEQFFNVTYQPLFDAEGQIDSVVSFAVDVTEQVEARKRSERLTAALRESEARYRSFVNQSTEGIWRIELAVPIEIDGPADPQLDAFCDGASLAECNDAMAQMHGYEHGEELVGRHLRELLVPEGPLNTEYLRAFIANGYRLEAVESQKSEPDGRSRVFRNSLVGVVEEGRLLRAWGTQRDVTAEVEAREQAEAGNRAKDEFLALLGHELRNPLSPILTALELMKLSDAQAFTKERAIIERQVSHVVRLVDDLLDVSRITRGKVSLERRRVDLAQVVRSAIELSSPLLEQRTHRLAVSVPPGLIVEGDPLRLSQVFANLLTNAAKYTPRGGDIAIEAERSKGIVRVQVRDTGIGIRQEMLPRIFDLFAQERQALDRSEGGLGLGLSIVKSLVELHGGRVEAQSEGKGRGSEFRVDLPLSDKLDAPAPAAQLQKSERAGVMRILIVDDNEDAASLLAKALRNWGQVAQVAHDGPSALKVVERFTPDIALLDIGLPAMDGYELARRLRALPALSNLRLVAVTGYGQARDRMAAEQAGFHEHVVKPVSLAMLEGVLSRTTASVAQ